MDKKLSNKPQNNEFTKTYYEHQYIRMASLEEQSFNFSNLVVILTTAIFAFIATQNNSVQSPSWQILIWVFLTVNLVAIVYILRVNDSVRIHQRRAKKILEIFAPKEYSIDQEFKQRFSGLLQSRPMLQLALHLTLIVAGIIFLN